MPRIENHYFDAVKVIVPDVYEDERGFFMESYREDLYRELGVDASFVQDNHSRSAKGVLRGMHFQWEPKQGKLVRVTQGAAFIVLVDIRKHSPTLGEWVGVDVTSENRRQVWAPPGFAHGFCALSDWLEVQYKCTSYYTPASESGIRWNDPDVGIVWPIESPTLSDKDRDAQSLADWITRAEADHFTY